MAAQENELPSLFKDLIKTLESHLIQQTSITHVIKSLKEMEALNMLEGHWLDKLVFTDFEEGDIAQIKKFGHQLHEEYQLSLSDVIEVIDLSQNYCLTSFPHTNLDFSAKRIVTNVNIAKEHLAHGYFLSSLDSFVDSFQNSSTFQKESEQIHTKNWLITLQAFFHDLSQPPPILEHTLCGFGTWLHTLEAKLILHANEALPFDMQGNILLTHRTMHEQAEYITTYLKQESYVKALSHLESFCQSFLMLDKYMNEARFNYLNNAYDHFLDFLMTESRQQKGLKFILFNHFGMVETGAINPEVKKGFLKDLSNAFINTLDKWNLDYIALEQDRRLHVVIKGQDELLDEQQRDIIDVTFANIDKKYNQAFYQQLYISCFDLMDIPSFETNLFASMLDKIKQRKPEENQKHLQAEELQEMHHQVNHDFKMLQNIEHHIENKSFQLHYQPIVDAEGGIESLEALIRLPTKHEMIQAENFLGVVERYHLTTEIDLIVFELLESNLESLKALSAQVNVNVYPHSLSKPEVIQQLTSLAKRANEVGITLMVEITEHEFMLNDDVLISLRDDLGIVFAIDDFGTGYSNVSKLVEYASRNQVTVAKLDGTLIDDIDHDSIKYEVVSFVAQMAMNLGLKPVILEFVDSESKLEALKNLPTDLLFQGHYFSKALPIEELNQKYVMAM